MHIQHLYVNSYNHSKGMADYARMCVCLCAVHLHLTVSSCPVPILKQLLLLYVCVCVCVVVLYLLFASTKLKRLSNDINYIQSI